MLAASASQFCFCTVAVTSARPRAGSAQRCGIRTKAAFVETESAPRSSDEEAVSGSCFYSLLGLSRTVKTSEIKVAYRQLARRYHPDVCRGDGLTPEECTRRFIEVQQAYETLSDPAQRALYDYEMMNPGRVRRGEGLGRRRPWQQRRRPWETQARWSSPEEQTEAMKSWQAQVESQMGGLKARRAPKAGSWAAQMAQARAHHASTEGPSS